MEKMTKGEGMTPEEYIAMVEEENKKLKEEVEQFNNDIQNMDEEYMALLNAYKHLKAKIEEMSR